MCLCVRVCTCMCVCVPPSCLLIGARPWVLGTQTEQGQQDQPGGQRCEEGSTHQGGALEEELSWVKAGDSVCGEARGMADT